MLNELLLIGIIMIFIGFIVMIIGLMSSARRSGGRVEGGGIILIGPIPILFASNAKIAILLIVLAIVLMVIVYLLFYYPLPR